MIIYTCPKCGGDLIPYVITTYPPISAYKCLKCEWRLEQRDVIERIPLYQSWLKEEAADKDGIE